eukprot:jgi/Hompol1/1389/HPOL_000060-RA
MAATAGGVAIGSTVGHVVGHGITSMFSGGSSNNNAPQQVQAPAAPQQQYQQQQPYGGVCEADQRAFNRCLETNGSDVGACQFYFDMLKQCKAQAGATL